MKINEKYKDIHDLKIIMVEQDILVEYHDQNYVELFYDGNPRGQIDIAVVEGELRVKSVNTLDQLLSINFKKGLLRLAVPKNVIQRVDLKTVSGNVFSEINCKQAIINTISGKIVSKGSFAEAIVESISGSICLYNPIENLRFKTTSGSVKCVSLTNTMITGSSISGSVIIANPKNAGYRIRFKSISGHFKDLKTRQRGAGKIEMVQGDGSSQFEVNTTSGHCKIDDWI